MSRNDSTVSELPPETVDRIAAGEVVTDPAAVVRELVANALDAGADSVEVTVENGGTDRIRVADDGHGMPRADALLAVERHTTSKLDDAGDLRSVATLGFRGEALPSIAEVSRFALTTRAEGHDAVRVTVDGEKATGSAGRGVGTTVEVRDLFHNRPARRETLGTPGREFARVSDCVGAFALAHPDVRFRLGHGERTVLSTPGSGEFADAALGVYDRTVASRSNTVGSERDGGVTVAGLVTHPSVTRTTRDHVHVAVNGLPVSDADLRQAVLSEYGTLLPDGRYPVATVAVAVPPETVDLNVHPAKREVGLTNRATVEEAVEAAVHGALSTADLARTAEVAFDLDSSLDPVTGESTFDATVIGQYRGLYLLCEADEDLLVVDQHAAHERINYERLLETVDGGVPSADLDPPTTVTLSAGEAAVVDEFREELERAGYRVAPFGGRTYRVEAVPAPLGRAAAPDSLHDALAAVREGERTDPRETLLKDVACHPSLKAGDDLSREVAGRLVERLGQCDQPYACPHGRPTVLSIDEATLARGFERGTTRL